jgi:T-complex protein 1 subunit gamma
MIVLTATTKRETGRKAQLGNIAAAKAVSDIVRTALGPKAMLKMLLSSMGGIVITNDGNAILREIEVTHPAAKSMIELSRAQDEEVGDGTTSVIIVAGELLYCAEPYLTRGVHPRTIISGYTRALEDSIEFLQRVAWKIDLNDRPQVMQVLQTCLGTKFTTRWSDLMCNLALDAVLTVALEADGRKEVDVKRYAKVEKIPGGEIEESCVLRGVMMNKDVTHAKMRRYIKNPRVLLLDCTLEYKKGENNVTVDITKESDFEALLKQEEQQIEQMCADILKFKPDLVVTEKGMSDLCQHILVKNGVTGLRRLRKTDNNRLARATGATIVARTDEIKESDIGQAGLFEVKKIGDEYFAFITECKEPKACTILLRGASKDVLNEVERNLQDALCVARNIVFDPRLVPGGGAVETALSVHLAERSKQLEGVQQWPYAAVGAALEVIPRTLAQNCGANAVRLLTELRAKHAANNAQNLCFGIDGNKGVVADMKAIGVVEPLVVKLQTIKTAVEAACLLLRVDDIVSGTKKKGAKDSAPSQPAPPTGDEE